MERELNATESINSMIGGAIAFMFAITDTWAGILTGMVVAIVVIIYQYSCMYDNKTDAGSPDNDRDRASQD